MPDRMKDQFCACAATLMEWIRFLIFFLQYFWAVLSFLFEYLEEVVEFEFNEFQQQGNPAGIQFRNLFVPILKVLVVALTTTSAYPRQYSQAPALMHFMDVNPVDGQYVFGYRATDSSREERRHADGTVEGKYSYKDPEGKVINVSYGADARGFQAYGDHLPPEDTPAVKEAKERFMATYAKEIARIRGNDVVTIHNVETNQSPDDLTDDSDVVLPSSEAEEQSDLKSAVLVVPAPNRFIVHPTHVRANTPKKAEQKIESGSANDYNWLYAMDPSPMYAHSPYPTSSFLIPIPLAAFRKVTAVHDPKVPKFGQRNYVFNVHRAGRKIS